MHICNMLAIILLWDMLSECRKREDIDHQQLYQDIDKGVIKEYQQLSVFWQNYTNPFKPLFKKYTYLKANSQSAGIIQLSYRFADT